MAKPYCFRPSPELAARIDAAAEGEGVTRAQWLVRAVEGALGQGSSGGDEGAPAPVVASSRVEAAPPRASVPADGSARVDAFRAAAARRLGR
jgi:hypothetical protein